MPLKVAARHKNIRNARLRISLNIAVQINSYFTNLRLISV